LRALEKKTLRQIETIKKSQKWSKSMRIYLKDLSQKVKVSFDKAMTEQKFW